MNKKEYDKGASNPLYYELPYYEIRGYNGYRISMEGLLQTLKNYKVEPHGHFLQPKFDRKGHGYYILSNDKNERKKVYIDELLKLARIDRPHGLMDGTYSSRNILTRKKHGASDTETYSLPSFSSLIIDNKPKLKVPVTFY